MPVLNIHSIKNKIDRTYERKLVSFCIEVSRPSQQFFNKYSGTCKSMNRAQGHNTVLPVWAEP